MRMKQPKAPGREARRRGRASAQTKLIEFSRTSGRVEDADAETAAAFARVEDTDARLGCVADGGGVIVPWASPRPWAWASLRPLALWAASASLAPASPAPRRQSLACAESSPASSGRP